MTAQPITPESYADHLVAGLVETIRKYCRPTGRSNTRDWTPVETMSDIYRMLPHWEREMLEDALGKDRMEVEFPRAVISAGWRSELSSETDPWRGLYFLPRSAS